MESCALILVMCIAVMVLRKPPTVVTSVPAAPAAPAIPPAQSAPAAPPVAAVRTQPEIKGDCRATWTFDQGSGDTIQGLTGNAHNGKLKGNGAIWLKSLSPDASGLRLDGSGYAEVPGPVINTTQSFSVSAWVRVELVEPKKAQTIVSIDGNATSAFFLRFIVPNDSSLKPGEGLFEMGFPVSDLKGALVTRASVRETPDPGTWYHLAGVYDSAAQVIRLYLNGELQKSVPCTNAWQGTGDTAIGRGLWDGSPSYFLHGSIRDVRLFAAALTAGQIKELAR